jgi:hypothetical protein
MLNVSLFVLAFLVIVGLPLALLAYIVRRVAVRPAMFVLVVALYATVLALAAAQVTKAARAEHAELQARCDPIAGTRFWCCDNGTIKEW